MIFAVAPNMVSKVAKFNTVNALVVVLDREGHIIRCNRVCEQTTGYKLNEVSNIQPFWELLLTPKQKEPIREVFKKLQSDKLAIAYENDYLTKDGKRMCRINSVNWY